MYKIKMMKNWLMAGLILLMMGSCGQSDGDQKEVHPKVAKLKLPTGFEAEHLYSPGENDQGSWVGMTFDDKNRLLTVDQYGAIYRLEVPAIGSDSLTPTVQKLIIGDNGDDKIGMGYAQALLYAFNSLYVMVNHRANDDFDKSTGLYRLQDTNGDDQFDKITTLKEFTGSPGEHGPHSMVVSPDGQSIYIVVGNHIDVPEMDHYRIPRVWENDNLIPEIKDPRGHANSRGAPGGWVAKIDPEGKEWELVSVGYRNPFDVAFNEVGDLFTYDSDMEWDFGMPWYRPTRINHVTSGSEYGWRTGNMKWSPEYTDNLPAVLNIGQGSPTNVFYGSKAKFPEEYRNALYAFDWSFGIMYKINLTPSGGSYSATGEEFISGSPLPLTDGVIGPDGALYFMTGGRRLESDLYRVHYTGDLSGESKGGLTEADLPEEHKIRRSLEAYHTGAKSGAIDFAWPYLSYSDRFVQYAARIAVEHQPLSEWQSKALNETNTKALTQAIIALARHGKASQRDQMIQALMKADYGSLDEGDKMNLARAFEVVIARHGNPSGAVRNQLIAYLDEHFPAETNEINRVMGKVLVKLEAPSAVPKLLGMLDEAEDDPNFQKTLTASSDLIMRNPRYGLDIANMLANVPPAQQTYLATVLGGAKAGWDESSYEEYFNWTNNAFQYKGGRSYVGFIDRARKMALSTVPKSKFDHYDELSGGKRLSGSGNEIVETTIQPEGPGKRWTVEEAAPLVEDLKGRDLEKGKAMFNATLCSSCHAMGGEGGVVGPDLTQLGTRFSPKDILEATINPNDVISDQYAAMVFVMGDKSSVVGRLLREDETTYYVSQNPFSPDMIMEIPKDKVTSTKESEVSVMLPGLVNRLNAEELKDLMAYLVSGGNPNHEVYQ
ncbi:c-type cytochrome [Cyclobacterium sp. 1_MG-2023]|uniref:c-type cytochrome n=1 Tax=Cyclobacterium sp. 1_MG-2023 TaxID=3062681 RepID=UPI0026E48C67|nr:c-type cytochrome [Cyclobacterium sp. 1_MG-2023]MDO6439768.1 c-type cytochrome [Cyclobacterium sp. 1_MG-2023]